MNNITITSSLTVVNGVNLGKALLPIQMVEVNIRREKVRVLFDNGSQSSFILSTTAQKLGLRGIPISYTLVCTDGSSKQMNRQEPSLALFVSTRAWYQHVAQAHE